MISETENPLTEVALALSMAFFSLMVLMLFAITNAPQSAAAQSAHIKRATSAEKTDAKPAYLVNGGIRRIFTPQPGTEAGLIKTGAVAAFGLRANHNIGFADVYAAGRNS